MTKILVLVSMCEIEYERFSFSSRELKNASRCSLFGGFQSFDEFCMELVTLHFALGVEDL